LILCGTISALLTSIVVIFFSHNVATSLCYCSVDHFIHAVAILKYDCKPVLNTIIKNMFVVGTYKP
jgi:hypothetical protein